MGLVKLRVYLRMFGCEAPGIKGFGLGATRFRGLGLGFRDP